MAIQLQGILGPVAGKVANLTFYRLFGKPCLRAVPATRLDTKSLKQVSNRLVFRSVADFLNQIYFDLIQPLMSTMPGIASPYFKFYKFNFAQFDAAGLANPTGLIISQGSLLQVLNFRFVDIINRDFYNFAWTNNANNANGYDSDMMYAMFYNHTLRSIQLLDTHPIRSSETVQQRMPLGWRGIHDIYAYVTFLKFNKLSASDNIILEI